MPRFRDCLSNTTSWMLVTSTNAAASAAVPSPQKEFHLIVSVLGLVAAFSQARANYKELAEAEKVNAPGSPQPGLKSNTPS